MSEKQFVTRVLGKLRSAFPAGLVLKHNDHFTVGIPDISVIFRGTTWLEFKELTEGESLQDRVQKDKLQFYNMLKIAENGTAYYVGYYKQGRDAQTYFSLPQHLKPTVEFEPTIITDKEQIPTITLAHMIRENPICVEGYADDVLFQLCRRTK